MLLSLSTRLLHCLPVLWSFLAWCPQQWFQILATHLESWCHHFTHENRSHNMRASQHFHHPSNLHHHLPCPFSYFRSERDSASYPNPAFHLGPGSPALSSQVPCCFDIFLFFNLVLSPGSSPEPLESCFCKTKHNNRNNFFSTYCFVSLKRAPSLVPLPLLSLQWFCFFSHPFVETSLTNVTLGCLFPGVCGIFSSLIPFFFNLTSQQQFTLLTIFFPSWTAFQFPIPVSERPHWFLFGQFFLNLLHKLLLFFPWLF